MDVVLAPDRRPLPSALLRDSRLTIAVLSLLLLLVTGWLGPDGWWQRLWDIALPIAWSVVIIRALAIRATLPSAAILGCLVLGVLVAASLAPMAARLANPYGGSGIWYERMTGLARLAALIVPLAALLMTGRLVRVLSSADGFLAGFAAGFGFDLLPLLLGTDRGHVPYTIDYLPPLQFVEVSRSVPGAGYWAALVLLTLVASIRFQRPLARLVRLPQRAGVLMPIGLTGLAFLWCGMELAAMASRDPDWWVLRAGRQGGVTPWVALAALALLSWAELRRTGPAEREQWTRDVSSLAAASARFDVREARRVLDAMRLRTQVTLGEAEPVAVAPDPAVRGYIRGATAALRRQGQPDAVLPSRPPLDPRRPWRDPAMVHAAGWLVLAAAVFLAPKADWLTKFWTLPIVHFGIGRTSFTVLTAVLAVVIVARVVRSMPEPRRLADAGEVATFRIEKAVLGFAAAIVLLIAFYTFPQGGVTLQSMAPALADRLPDPPIPLLLLVALAATGVAVRRSAVWNAQPVSVRRPGVIRQALALIVGLVLGWLALTLYPSVVTALHAQFGPVLKPWFVNWYGAGQDAAAGFGTSNTLAVVSAVIVAAIGFGGALALRAWSRRVEGFLIDETSEHAR